MFRTAFNSSIRRHAMPPPLTKIRVLDLTRVLAGPYATMLLADLGAQVFKVEHPTRGDDTRAWNPPSAPSISNLSESGQDWSKLPEESAYFLSVNRNKKSLGINLKSKKGIEIVKKMIESCDVLVENYVPGKLNELGLSYEVCKAINPKLIYASITGYGQTGPYASRPGYDVMIEAEAGFMHITGEPDSAPVKVGVAITDLTTGLYVHGAIMAALISRSQTNQGVWIDCSLFESQIASLANIGSNYLIAGQEATRQGTAHPSIVPYQNLPTKDGWIMLGAGNDKQFSKLCSLLSTPWSTSPLYSTNATRVANRSTLIPLLIESLSKKTTAEWLLVMQGHGFPFAPVNDIAGTFAHPQAIDRGVVVEVEHPRAGKIKLLAPAVVYNGEKMKVRSAPPVLGQHTVEVLKEEFGYTAEEIVDFQQDGAIN